MHLYKYSAYRNPRSISRTILLKFVIFSPLFFNFFSKSQIWKTWGLNWEKRILFCIGNGAEYRPQIRQIESPGTVNFYFTTSWSRSTVLSPIELLISSQCPVNELPYLYHPRRLSPPPVCPHPHPMQKNRPQGTTTWWAYWCRNTVAGARLQSPHPHWGSRPPNWSSLGVGPSSSYLPR